MNDIYNEGFSAFSENKDYSDNPYRSGSKQHRDWADGWAAASVEADDGDMSYEDEEDDFARYQDWINE